MTKIAAIIVVIGFIFVLTLILEIRDRKRTAKAASMTHTRQQAARPSLSNRLRLRSHFLAVKWIIGTLAAFLALAATVYQAWGPFWPTPPDIEAQTEGSSLILPFAISSKNFFFPVITVTLNCYVNLLYVMDADKKTITLRDSMFRGGTAIVGPGVNYSCDAELLSVKPDGSLIIGFQNGQFMSTVPGTFRAPLSVLKLCVSITGSYDNRFSAGHMLPPIMYQWPSVPNGHQWAKGGVVFDDESKWTPPDSKVGAAYGLRRVGDGHGSLIPGALTCDQLNR